MCAGKGDTYSKTTVNHSREVKILVALKAGDKVLF